MHSECIVNAQRLNAYREQIQQPDHIYTQLKTVILPLAYLLIPILNVVSAASPDPLLIEVPGTRGGRAAAGGELSIATRP